MLIREARREDIPAVLAIYNEEVLHGTATFDTEPKTEADYQTWFDKHDRSRYCILVADEQDEVLGWARLYPWSDRCAYARTAENSVYVRKDHRGRGIGSALLRELISRARAAGICVLIARIAEGNPTSVRVHEREGFETIGIMRRVGEKFGRVLDVRLMQKHLDR